MFVEVLERKEAFIDNKNIDLQKAENLHFCKGVSPWFLSKNLHFSMFCFNAKWNNNKGLVKFYIKQGVKKCQKFAFFQRKLVHSFSQNIQIFQYLVLMQNGWIKSVC